MEFLFDTASLDDLRTYGPCFPYTGLTSNPSIIKAAGVTDFFAHFRAIRQEIGPHRTLHIQTLGARADNILREAEVILSHVDDEVYIKVPATEEGLRAMQALKARGIGVTATAIYSKIQGFLAISAGADFIAPYYNRMENLDVDAADVISSLAIMAARGYSAKIVAASFKNINQVSRALEAGAHAVTVPPALLHETLGMAAVQKAVDDFTADWERVLPGESILSLGEKDGCR